MNPTYTPTGFFCFFLFYFITAIVAGLGSSFIYHWFFPLEEKLLLIFTIGVLGYTYMYAHLLIYTVKKIHKKEGYIK